MKKVLVSLLIIIAAVVVGSYYYQQRKNRVEQNTSQNSKPSANTYTLEEVAKHGLDPDVESYSCWTVIHGKVYDITDFADGQHPGGESIYMACGKDGTEFFEKRPVGSGQPHSAEARKILEKYYIGDLRK